MFISDKPIESEQEDLLGRSSFAKNLGKALLSYKNNESLVVGLYGKWGSGKSSVINICLQYVESQGNTEDSKRPILLRFNPWNYSDQNQLIEQFFNEMSAILKKNLVPENAIKIGEKLIRYSEFFKPLKYIPVVGRYSEMAVEITELISNAYNSVSEPKELSEIKSELNELLNDQKIRIIVVIDDIDRLNNQEVRQVFQLVKSLGDFKNTIYLLAFDIEVVANALVKVQEGSGEEYLEKIIQVPFELPVINDKELEQVLFNNLDQILHEVPKEFFDQTYWGNIYYSGFKKFFNNLRDINRYCNSLLFGFELIKDEVNPIDFMAITALQIFLPKVYYSIRDHKDLFTGVMDDYLSGDRQKQEYGQLLNEILREIPDQYEIKDMLKRMFPKIESIIGNTNYGYSWLNGWRKSKRVCSPDCFDAYFKLSIPKTEFSSKEIKTIINLASEYNEFLDYLHQLVRDNRIIRFLELFEDYTESEVPISTIENVCLALLNIGDDIPNVTSGMFELFNSDVRISRVIYQLCWRHNSIDERGSLIKNVIRSTSDSLYTVVYFVNRLRREHGKDTDDGSEPHDKITVNEQELRDIELLTLNKIIQWAREDKLLKLSKMVSLLYSWKRFGGEEELTSFIQNIEMDDRKLISFISGFMYEVSTASFGDFVGRKHWEINKKNLSDFLNVTEIEGKVRRIIDNRIYSDISEKEELGLSLILETNKNADD